MKLFYGWVIVGVAMVVTCVGFGAMFSLGVFLQPMSESMGWSRTGISTAALLNFLCMGVGSFFWGALSDRIGTRAVVLLGGVLLGLGTVMASRAPTLGHFQIYFGVVVGFAAGSLYTPLTATTTRWFTRHRSLAVALVSAGLGLGSTTTAPLARWIITNYDWRTAMLVLGDLAWLVIIPAALLVREPPAPATAAVPEPTAGVGWQRAHGGAGAAHTPVRRHRAHVLRVLRGALGSDLPHGHPRDRPRRVGDGRGDGVQRGGPGLAERQDHLRAHGRPRRREAVLVAGLALQAIAMSLYLVTRELSQFYAVALMFGFAYGGVMPLYAIIVREYFGARNMGAIFGAAGFASTLGMAIGPVAGGWLYDTSGSYAWLFIGSSAIGLGAVAIAFTFRPPSSVPAALPSPSVAH